MAFLNLLAMGRRPHYKRAGVFPDSEDLSYIPNIADVFPVDLTPQIDGTTTSFSLPFDVPTIESILWNNTRILVAQPGGFGYTFNGLSGITTTFVPQIGDTLIAQVWPQ